jgi:hypothetical protein
MLLERKNEQELSRLSAVCEAVYFHIFPLIWVIMGILLAGRSRHSANNLSLRFREWDWLHRSG